MAKNLTDATGAAVDEGTPSANKEHNVKHRREAVNKSLEQLYQLDCKIGAALEKHVKPHRAGKTDIKAKLKNDYQMTPAVVQARYAAYKLERQAQDAEDDTTLDSIRELFEHLPVGGHVDLVTAAEQAAE